MATTSIKFGDFEAAQAVLRDIRSDASPTNWVVYSYSDDDSLIVAGSGTGDVEELKPLLLPTGRSYAFIRVIDYVDNHRTIKFVFIVWAGDRVPVVKRARMATHKGSITSFIGQFHISIDASSADEISTELVMERVRDASGSGSRVKSGGSAVDAHMAPQASHIHDQVPEPTPIVTTTTAAPTTRVTPVEPKKVVVSTASRVAHPSVPKASQGVQFPDRETLDAAIRAVRSDSDPTTWALFGYQGDTDNLELVGQGEGDIDAITELLQDDKINYGLLRTTDRFDGHLTVKFVFLVWIGERVKIMRKARIATHKGAIVTFVGQYHTDLEATKHEEVTQEEVRRKVQFAAGTAVHVKSS